MISLKLLAAELLFACPGCKEEHQDDLTSLIRNIYVPDEITETPLSFRRAVRIYASPNNPGAREVADVLKKAMAGLELSTEPPPAATHFLLYLAQDTFVGEAGEELAKEVRAEMRADRPIVMLHENDLENGGCEFAWFFSTTPQDLIVDGLYKALAFAYYPDPFRNVSLTLVAKQLGAEPLRRSCAWRGGVSFNDESATAVQVVVLRKDALGISKALPEASISKSTDRPLPKVKRYTPRQERLKASSGASGISDQRV